MTGISLGIGAWGLVTGIAMVKAGLGLALAITMSLLVFAGSAQLASLPLIVQGAPLWVIWATAFCVNLRFIIFSAGWRPYFAPLARRHRLWVTYFMADLNYVAFMKRFPKPGSMSDQLPYLWGGVAVNWTAWQVMSLIGIVLADVIPTQWGLGFAGSLALLGITGTLLVDRGTWIAALVAACAAFAAFALPFHLNIVVAIAAAIAIGVLVDHVSPPASAKAAAGSDA
ncbi:MAG: AzlC family ABC transporter permease [Burkholderiaceae bacterium]|jgi:predicted branched-subunit amino acid permease